MARICDEKYYVEARGIFLNNVGSFQSGGAVAKIVTEPDLPFTQDGIAGQSLTGEFAYWYKIGNQRFNEAGWRLGGVSIFIYTLQSGSCICESGDITIQCVTQRGKICCITKSLINELCSRLKR